MRLPRWLLPMILVAGVTFTAGWAFARVSAPKRLPPGVEYFRLQFGVNITYDDGTKLIPGKPLRLSFYRLGDRKLDDWQFVVVRARPDELGFMSGVAQVPMESWRVPLAQRLLR